MKDYESTEIAYRNGYAQGLKDAVKHGRWIAQDNTFTRFMCSECKSKNHRERTDYCPNCGAKMDLKEEA